MSGTQQGTNHCPKGRLKVPQPAPTTSSTFPEPIAQSQGHWFSCHSCGDKEQHRLPGMKDGIELETQKLDQLCQSRAGPQAWHQPLNPGSCLPYWPLNMDACLPTQSLTVSNGTDSGSKQFLLFIHSAWQPTPSGIDAILGNSSCVKGHKPGWLLSR